MKLDWKRWAFVLVPLVGVVELGLHVKQVYGVVPERDWLAARDVVKGVVKPDDLVVFAPAWADPLGRRYFGRDIATVEREARPDDTRFPRAIEVSIRGEHDADLAGWHEAAKQKVGAITITTLENPHPAHLLDDLVTHATASRMSVAHVEGGRAQDCVFMHGPVKTGNLGFGPAIPGDRAECAGGGFVGVTVFAVLDYTARRCIYAPPPGGSGATRITFHDVTMGRALHGHHGLYAEAERNKTGTPVKIAFSIGDESLGKLTHEDGDGWTEFELDTTPWAGKKADVVAEISSTNGTRRMYCFEADTR